MEMFGPGFAPASDALAVLLLLPAAQTLSAIQTHALYAVDRPLATTTTAAVRLLVTAAATLAGVKLFGITGAAIGIVAGAVVDVGIKLVMLRRHLETNLVRLWSRRQIAATAIAYGAGFAAALVVAHALANPLDIIAALAAGTLTYVLALVGTGGIARRDVERMRNARALLRLRMRRPASPVGTPLSATAPINEDPRT
jgi:O-antigen/teichoic acid export membrane protein